MDTGTQARDTEDTEEDASPQLAPSVLCVQSSCRRRLLAHAFTSSDPAERLRLCRDAVALDRALRGRELALAAPAREPRRRRRARGARSRRRSRAGLGSGALRKRQAVAGATTTWRARATRFSAPPISCRPSPPLSATSARRSASSASRPRALAAFRQALAHDPLSFTILNNIGVVYRELGRLDESEAAFRRVIAINPAFVFGHYNLGHTLFLAGRTATRSTRTRRGSGATRSRTGGKAAAWRSCALRTATRPARSATLALRRRGAARRTRGPAARGLRDRARAADAASGARTPHRPFLERIGAEIVKSE